MFLWSEWAVIAHCPIVDEAVSKLEGYLDGNGEEERVERKNLVAEALKSLINLVLFLIWSSTGRC
jgi:hypothetical protein